ncbi:MAG: ABC transporter ATP-binding protein [Chloroflexi bacterium]|nr:ABC transporter ATP-binding protein [Chloroflexota bacterium]
MFPIKFDSVSKKFVIHHQKNRSFQDMVVNFLRSDGIKEQFWALHEVSFGVEGGETLGIIGENGSGKSTVLKLITGIIEPSAGRVSVNGKVAALLELGSGFHPDLSGRENIYLNGSLLGLTKKSLDRKLDDIVGFAELERFIDTPIKHYSSGMYMRLAFAIAINLEPEILLIDEILSVGDEIFQRKCLDKISELQGRCLAIVFVSHDLSAVRNLCSRAIWLEGGVKKADGAPGEVVDSYLAAANKKDRARLQARAGSDVSASNRWGTREVEITGVQFVDAREALCDVFETGEQLIARIHYSAVTRITKPVFGVAIFREDGIHVNGPNTKTSDYPIDYVDGTGCIDYIIPSLPLLEGSYRLSASVYDNSCTHPYDHHDRMYAFKVQPSSVKERFGTFFIPSRWHLKGS